MTIFLGILLLLAGFGFIAFTLDLDYGASIKNKFKCFIYIISAGMLWGLSLYCFLTNERDYSYPAKKYHLLIKTTTIDNQTDTTYVITERSNTH